MDAATRRATQAQYTFEHRDSHLGHLPGPILRDIARNDSAPREWRKAAIELMLDKGFPEVNHPDLALMLEEVKHQREAKDEVQSIVESAIEAPLEDHIAISHPLKDLAEEVKLSYPTGQVLTPLTPDTIKAAPEPFGPFKASFTTQSQTQDEVV